VRAELKIFYRSDRDGARLLEHVYGSHDSAALNASELARRAPAAAHGIEYANAKPDHIVLAWFLGNHAELYVEAMPGHALRDVAVSAWDAIRDTGKAWKPKLARLALVDEDAADVLVTARLGVGGALKLKRGDLVAPIATGGVSAVVAGLAGAGTFGHVTTDFFYGSATPVGIAILSVGLLACPSKDLVWR